MTNEAIEVIKAKLISEWVAANTDNITPDFSLIYDTMARDFGEETTYIRVYTRNTISDTYQTGDDNLEETENITIDISTMHSRAHMIKCLKEVKRIFKANRSLNDSDAHQMQPPSWTDKSDRRRKIWSVAMEYPVRRWNV